MSILIEYNKKIEVTQTQYNILMNHLKGIVCGLKKESKFYIKIWLMSYKKDVEHILNNY